MKKFAMTAMGLLFTIASFSQKRTVIFEDSSNKKTELRYSMIKKSEVPSEGKLNFKTTYCITNDAGEFLFELIIIHHKPSDGVSSFLSIKGNQSPSQCFPNRKTDLLKFDMTNLSRVSTLEDGRRFIWGDIAYEIKWLDLEESYIGLNQYAIMDEGDAFGFTFK